MSFRSISLTIIIASFIAWLHFPTLNAQSSFDEQGLAIRPAILDVAVDELAENYFISLANTSTEAVAVEARIEPLVVDEEFVNLAERIRYDISTWIELDQTSWLVDRGEDIQVKLTITPPENATPGGHYGQIAFRAISTSGVADTSSAKIIPEVTALIFVTVPGEVYESLDIRQDIGAAFSYSNSISSTITFINNGNTHSIVQPYLRIDSGKSDGNVIGSSANPLVIMPGTTRTVSITADAPGWLSSYKVWSEAIYGTPSVSVETTKQQVLVISSTVMLSLLGLLIVIALIMVNRRPRATSFNHRRKRYGRSKKYTNPRKKTETELIRSQQ